MGKTFTCFVLACCFATTPLFSQDNHSFQRRWQTEDGAVLVNYDAIALPDRGNVFGGLVEFTPGSNLYLPCIWRTDCQGKVKWAKTFNTLTETPNNAYGRVLALGDNDFALVASTGFFFTSPLNDIFVARVDGDGNTLWAEILGGGSGGQDVAQGAVATADGGLVIAGKTASYGTDANTSSVYTDQYFIKLNGNGQIVWSKTVGNPQAIDRAYDIKELADGSFAVAGSYLHEGTFYANLLKLSPSGDLLWNRGFGEPIAPQANHGYGLLATSDGGFLVLGGSTNLHENFQDFPDFLVAKTDANGMAEWTRVFAGSLGDYSESASSAVELPNGNYAIAGATSSYPSQGFVPNKFTVLELSPTGSLEQVIGYNGGSSHYPRIKPDPYEGGYLVNGFTNWTGYGGNGNLFEPILVNTDANLNMDGCFQTALTALTISANPSFDLPTDLPSVSGTGAAILPIIVDASDLNLKDSTICESNGYADCAPFSSSFERNLAFDFEVYPNPAQAGQTIHIYWSEPAVREVLIYDVNGRLVQKHRPVFAMQNVESRLEKPGVYFVKLWNGESSVTRKLLVW
ncbi:MAG: T9SS type A sorting domain-containing protein [Saprospiraceae bacterium]|nr:T9SS type A sorting domain-containing protein [Saprospiraceae bacterium]